MKIKNLKLIIALLSFFTIEEVTGKSENTVNYDPSLYFFDTNYKCYWDSYKFYKGGQARFCIRRCKVHYSKNLYSPRCIFCPIPCSFCASPLLKFTFNWTDSKYNKYYSTDYQNCFFHSVHAIVPRKIRSRGGVTIKEDVKCTKRDHCKTSPCQNQGTCVNLFYSYTCICPDNYYGKDCTKKEVNAALNGKLTRGVQLWFPLEVTAGRIFPFVVTLEHEESDQQIEVSTMSGYTVTLRRRHKIKDFPENCPGNDCRCDQKGCKYAYSGTLLADNVFIRNAYINNVPIMNFRIYAWAFVTNITIKVYNEKLGSGKERTPVYEDQVKSFTLLRFQTIFFNSDIYPTSDCQAFIRRHSIKSGACSKTFDERTNIKNDIVATFEFDPFYVEYGWQVYKNSGDSQEMVGEEKDKISHIKACKLYKRQYIWRTYRVKDLTEMTDATEDSLAIKDLCTPKHPNNMDRHQICDSNKKIMKKLKGGDYMVRLTLQLYQRTSDASQRFTQNHQSNYYCYFNLKEQNRVFKITNAHINANCKGSFETTGYDKNDGLVHWSCKAEKGGPCPTKELAVNTKPFIDNVKFKDGVYTICALWEDSDGETVDKPCTKVEAKNCETPKVDEPDYVIYCKSNCDENRDPNVPVRLTVVDRAHNGTSPKNVTYKIFDSKGKEVPLNEISPKNVGPLDISIDVNKLKPGEDYKIVGEVAHSPAGSPPYKTEPYLIRYNKPELPGNGTCIMNPLKGMRGYTVFDIKCYGWGNGDAIIFEFFDKGAEDIDHYQGRMMGFSYSGILPAFRLTRSGKVTVFLLNDAGEGPSFNLTIELIDFNKNVSHLDYLMEAIDITIENELYEEAEDIISTVAEILYEGIDLDYYVRKLLKAMQKVRYSSQEDMKLGISTIQSVLDHGTLHGEYLLDDILEMYTGEILLNLARVYLKYATTPNLTPRLRTVFINQLSRNMMDCVDMTMIAQQKNVSKLDPEEDINYDVMDNWNTASNDISEALIIASYLVGRAHQFGTPGVEVISPQNVTYLKAYVDNALGLVNIAGSNLSSYANITTALAKLFDANHDIMLQFGTMNKNLFWWAKHNINSEVLLVGLAEKLYRPGYYYVPYVQSPIQIFLKVQKPVTTTVSGVALQLDPNLGNLTLDRILLVHRFLVPPLGRLYITFNFNGTEPTSSSFRVLVYYNLRPNWESMSEAQIVDTRNPVVEIPYDIIEREHFYYMGILPEKNVAVNDTVAYSFQVHYANCYIWENQWVNHYCLVGSSTSLETVECQCTHLSIFSSTIFIPPNDINPILDEPLFLTMYENLWVAVLVAIILILFLLLLIWACWRDRKDALCREVIVLEDNYPGEDYAYLIAVFTGTRLTSGTSAVVGLRLYGEIYASRPTILKSEKRKILQRDNDDWFLLTYPVSLGVLNAVQLWHNNAGIWPDWFCSKIIVYDIPAKTQYLFVVDQWVAMEANEFPEVMARPATSDEVFSIKRIFKDNSILGFREDHRHITVLTRHPRSPVARKERLIVLMVLVMSSMLASIMFFHLSDNFDITVDAYSYNFGLRELIISIQAFIISTLFACIAMFLFRKSYKLEIMRHRSTLFTPRKRSEESDIYWRSKKPDFVDLSTFIAHDEKLPKLHKDMTVCESIFATLKSCCCSRHTSSLRPVQLSSKDKEITVRVVWLILAWLFSFLVIIVCACFVILFSLRLGEIKAYQWLSSLVVSQAQDIFLFTPLKILIVSMLLSCSFERMSDVSTFKLDVNKALRYDMVGKRGYLDYLIKLRQQSIYYPMSDEAKVKRRLRAMRKLKWRIICDFIAVLTFILVLCYIMRGLWGSHYHTNTHADDIMMDKFEGRFVALRDVFNRTQFFSYLENTFVRSLFGFRWLNKLNFPILSPPDATRRKDWAKDYVSKLMGAPRLRQLRVISTPCTLQQTTDFGIQECIQPWNAWYMDIDTYGLQWKKEEKFDQEAYASGYRTQWIYRQPSNTSVFPLSGKTGIWYPSGGYVLLLAVKRDSSKSYAIKVEEEHWVDHRTRAVFLELTLYNVNTNLFTQVTAIIEQMTSGLVWTSIHVNSVDTEHGWDIINAIYIIFIVTLFFRIAYNVNRNGFVNFIFKFINMYEVTVIVIGILSIVYYLIHIKVSTFYLDEFHSRGEDLFFNFREMIKYFMYTKELLWILFCLLVFRSFLSWYFGPTYIPFYNTFFLSKRWIIDLMVLLLLYYTIIWRLLGYTIDAKVFYNYQINILHYKMFTIFYEDREKQERTKMVLLGLFYLAIFIKAIFIVMFTHYYKIGKRKKLKPMSHFNMLRFVISEFKWKKGNKNELSGRSDREVHLKRDMDIPKTSY